VTWPQEPASGRRCRREVVKSVGLLALHARKWHGRCTSEKRLSRFLSSDGTHVSTPLHADATNARRRARFSARIRQAGLGCDWGIMDANRMDPTRQGLAHRCDFPSRRPEYLTCILYLAGHCDDDACDTCARLAHPSSTSSDSLARMLEHSGG
jgi:hypothetical protein